MMRALRVALGFLTVLPVGAVRDASPAEVRASVRAYPLVGLLLGALLALAWLGLRELPLPLASVLLVAWWVLLTGALHLDGLADSADAAFTSRTPAQRRAIAADPHVGTFALATVVLALGLRAASVGSLPTGGAVLAWLVLAPLIARSIVPVPMALYPVHVDSRLGRDARPGRAAASLTALAGCGLALGVGAATVGIGPALTALTGALVAALLLAAWLRRRLEGLGGDAYGGIVEVTEIAVLIAAVAA